NSGSGSGSTARVYFDENTTVDYQGQSFRPENLERGDEVTVNVDQSGNQLIAQRINVTYNANGSGTNNSSTYPSSGSSQASTVRGTVRSIDTSRRTIQLESTSWLNNNYNGNTSNGSTITVYYDANAGIDVNGSLQAISGLERGDVIEVQLRSSGSTYVADRLYLVRDINR
ncbi:MAG: hypothetical protein QOH21_1970, partial [Acidobacteriota bacterium]|nr:hypothetical protein [Acidobacteriota bacterium]